MSGLDGFRWFYIALNTARKQSGWLCGFQTAEAAITLADWFANQQLAIVDRNRRKRRLEIEQQVFTLIEISKNGCISARDLHRARASYTAEEAKAILLRMVDKGKLRCTKRIPKGGGHTVLMFNR